MGENRSDHTETLNDNRSHIREIRQSFRVPVSPKNNISAKLAGKKYRVSDISPGGVKIMGTEQAGFTPDQLIDGCELTFADGRVKQLTARLVYSSPGNGSGETSGVQWVNLSDPALDKIAARVAKIKSALRQTIQDQPA